MAFNWKNSKEAGKREGDGSRKVRAPLAELPSEGVSENVNKGDKLKTTEGGVFTTMGGSGFQKLRAPLSELPSETTTHHRISCGSVTSYADSSFTSEISGTGDSGLGLTSQEYDEEDLGSVVSMPDFQKLKFGGGGSTTAGSSSFQIWSEESDQESKPYKKGKLSSPFELFEQSPQSQSQTSLTSESSARLKRNSFESKEYYNDILTYWLGFEERVRWDSSYMSKQKDISHRMRTILVDWLVEVGLEYEMQPETLYIAVSLMDRFLGKMAVARGKLQLVGTAALYIAAKYEEVLPPDVSDFVYITDQTYNKSQIVKMEAIILVSLEYQLTLPTTYDFLNAFATMLDLDSRSLTLANYFAELSLLDGERYLRFSPSIIAAASLALARYTFTDLFWDEPLGQLCHSSIHDVQKCAQHLFNSFYDAPTYSHTATYDKYKSPRFNSIANTLLPAKLPWI